MQGIPDFVQKVINELISENDIMSVWLVGSQANNNATPQSDWDILVFSNKEVITVKQRHEKVDVIRVGLSGTVLLEGKSMNIYQLKFENWHWCEELDKEKANYKGRKFKEYPDCVRNFNDPIFELKSSTAFCLWRR